MPEDYFRHADYSLTPLPDSHARCQMPLLIADDAFRQLPHYFHAAFAIFTPPLPLIIDYMRSKRARRCRLIHRRQTALTPARRSRHAPPRVVADVEDMSPALFCRYDAASAAAPSFDAALARFCSATPLVFRAQRRVAISAAALRSPARQ